MKTDSSLSRLPCAEEVVHTDDDKQAPFCVVVRRRLQDTGLATDRHLLSLTTSTTRSEEHLCPRTWLPCNKPTTDPGLDSPDVRCPPRVPAPEGTLHSQQHQASHKPSVDRIVNDRLHVYAGRCSSKKLVPSSPRTSAPGRPNGTRPLGSCRSHLLVRTHLVVLL